MCNTCTHQHAPNTNKHAHTRTHTHRFTQVSMSLDVMPVLPSPEKRGQNGYTQQLQSQLQHTTARASSVAHTQYTRAPSRSENWVIRKWPDHHHVWRVHTTSLPMWPARPLTTPRWCHTVNTNTSNITTSIITNVWQCRKYSSQKVCRYWVQQWITILWL